MQLQITTSKLLVLALILIAGFRLIRQGYFPMHDDLHIIRLDQMEKCFQDGQIPCRWTPDMGFGYGLPLFNYYSPFVYYFGMIFRFLGLNFVLVTKLLFLTALALSGFGMYLLGKEFYGRQGGLLASALFVLGPYRAVQVYVRGALAECWAVSLLPLVFLFVYKYIKTEKSKYFLLSVLSIFLFLISHNILVMISLPILLVWIIGWIINHKAYHLIKNVVLVLVLSFGLSAFFTLPAFFERDLVTIQELTKDYFNFRHHFVSWKQLFLSRYWGYGSSQPGIGDELSLQIGWPHWLLGIIGFGGSWPTLFFSLVGLFSTFMIHAKSVFIWEMIPILTFVQFPWRFLGLVLFGFSLSAGAVVKKINKGIFRTLFVFTAILITIGLNLSYFQPKEYNLSLTDLEKLSGEQSQAQIKGSINDYLPKQVNEIPGEKGEEPKVVQGEAKIFDFKEKSNFFSFKVESIGDEDVKLQLPVFDFPNWQLLVDRQEKPHRVNDQTGLIEVNIPSGVHRVQGWFKNTKIRDYANLITIFSFLVLLFIIVNNDSQNNRKK